MLQLCSPQNWAREKEHWPPLLTKQEIGGNCVLCSEQHYLHIRQREALFSI